MPRSPLVIILLAVFVALVGFGIVIPLLPVYAEKFGAGGFEIGLLLMSYSLMQFLIAPIAGRISDRIGRRPVIIFALLLTTFSYVLFGLAESLPLLFVSRMLAGIGGADITVAQAYIADITPPEDRVKGMGLFGAGFGVGFTVGPVLGGLLAPLGHGVPAFVAAGFAGITAVYAIFALPEPQRQKQERSRLEKKVRGLPRGVLQIIVIYFFAVFAQGQLQSMFVLFTLTQLGWSITTNGIFLGIFGMISATVQGGLIGTLSKVFGQRMLVRVGLVLMGIGMICIASMGGIPLLVAGGMINALGFAMVMPSLSSLVSLRAPVQRQGRMLGTFQSFGSLARIMGPVVGGTLFDRLFPSAPFYFGAILAVTTGIAAWLALVDETTSNDR